MGCEWNEPGNYDIGFDTCDADSGEPMCVESISFLSSWIVLISASNIYRGVYRQEDGSESTWRQGTKPTPRPHPAPSSSNCADGEIPPATYSPSQRKNKVRMLEKMF
jgi:hypothetical protein